MKKVKLFCLPYAGGSASIYQVWKKYLSGDIELIPIELAGRGRRINEPLYKNHCEAVEDIYSIFLKHMDGTEYALFGHSMGTILAYELVRKIRAEKRNEPLHVFFSGRYPPYVKNPDRDIIYNLPEDKFLNKVFEHGGTSEEVIKNKELMELFSPILRSDYKLVEVYEHTGDIFKFNCDITVLHGKHDSFVPCELVQKWQECTKGKYSMLEFDDGHFFINKFKEEITQLINKTLRENL